MANPSLQLTALQHTEDRKAAEAGTKAQGTEIGVLAGHPSARVRCGEVGLRRADRTHVTEVRSKRQDTGDGSCAPAVGNATSLRRGRLCLLRTAGDIWRCFWRLPQGGRGGASILTGRSQGRCYPKAENSPAQCQQRECREAPLERVTGETGISVSCVPMHINYTPKARMLLISCRSAE